MSDAPDDPTGDALRRATQEMIQAARVFLDAAEQALADDQKVAQWAERGQEMVQEFLAGFASSPSPPEGPDDDPGIEHIDLD